jgi:hypothetical protein
MKKLLLALFVLVVVAVMCQAANVSFSYPVTGSKVPWKQTVMVTWTYTGHPASALVKLVLFQNGTEPANKVGNVVQNITLGAGSCPWRGGQLESGEYAGIGGNYYLRIISMNGDFNYFSPPFSIVLPKIPPEELHRKWYDLNPDPGCPMCGVFDIGALLAELGNPPPDLIGDLVILRNGRQVGLLGKLGQGGLSASSKVKLQFGAGDFALLGQANQGFEVAIVGAGGNILKRQALSLKLR